MSIATFKKTCRYLLITNVFVSLFVGDVLSQSQTVGAADSSPVSAQCDSGGAAICCAPNLEPIDATLDDSLDRFVYVNVTQLSGGPSGTDPVPAIMQGSLATSHLAARPASLRYAPPKSKESPAPSLPVASELADNSPNPPNRSPGQPFGMLPITIAIPSASMGGADSAALLLEQRTLQRAHIRRQEEKELRQERELQSRRHSQCVQLQMSDLECRLATTTREVLANHHSSMRPAPRQDPEGHQLLNH